MKPEEPGDLGPWLEQAEELASKFRRWAETSEPDPTEGEAVTELTRRVAFALKGAAASAWMAAYERAVNVPAREDSAVHEFRRRLLDTLHAEVVLAALAAAIRGGSKPEEGE